MGMANLLTQGIGVATGLQERFDWRGVMASAASGYVSTSVGNSLRAGTSASTAKIITNLAARLTSAAAASPKPCPASLAM